MSKRRTRKQKESAKHAFTISWQPDISSIQSEAKGAVSEADVNRQTQTDLKTERLKDLKTKHSDKSDKLINLGSIKKDLVKSLILATFILGSEVVLYLIWR